MEKEHLQVYLRIRPLTTTDNELGESQVCEAFKTESFVVVDIDAASVTDVIERFCFSHFTGMHFSRVPQHRGFKSS